MSKVKSESEEYVRHVPPRLYFKGRFKRKWEMFIKELNRLRDEKIITEYDYIMCYSDPYRAIEFEFTVEIKGKEFILDFDSIRDKADLRKSLGLI